MAVAAMTASTVGPRESRTSSATRRSQSVASSPRARVRVLAAVCSFRPGPADTAAIMSRANRLSGGAGHDTLIGGSGRDRLYGDSGNDRMYSRDRHRDRINGGSGRLGHGRPFRPPPLDRTPEAPPPLETQVPGGRGACQPLGERCIGQVHSPGALVARRPLARSRPKARPGLPRPLSLVWRGAASAAVHALVGKSGHRGDE